MQLAAVFLAGFGLALLISLGRGTYRSQRVSPGVARVVGLAAIGAAVVLFVVAFA